MKSVLQRMLKDSELYNIEDYDGHDVWLDCSAVPSETAEESKVILERMYPNEKYRIVLVEG